MLSRRDILKGAVATAALAAVATIPGARRLLGETIYDFQPIGLVAGDSIKFSVFQADGYPPVFFDCVATQAGVVSSVLVNERGEFFMNSEGCE